MNITITITKRENEILESYLGIGKVQEWLQHCIDNKIRKRLDAVIIEQTNLNPEKLAKAEKIEAIKSVALPTRNQRTKGV